MTTTIPLVSEFDTDQIPDPSDPDTFHARAFYVWNMEAAVIPEKNAQATAQNAVAASLANAANAAEWAAGAYETGDRVWSPTDLQLYQALADHTSSTDPVYDPTNWTLLEGFPVSHMVDTDNPHAVTADQVGMARATVQHVRDGTYVYDVVTVSDPKAVRKYAGAGVASDGVVDRATLRETAKAQGFQIVTNCDGWENADGSPGYEETSARPRGLHIAAGVVYQDFLESETHDVAVTMSASGNLGTATADDGLSAAERVTAGIVWAATWGDFCVVDGSAVDLDSSILGTTVSAWTVIGQRADGTILLVAIEGVTGSYGATATQAGVIMESLGCQIAYILDGGGSSQIWWKNCYASHSSDEQNNFLTERAVPTFLYVDTEYPVDDYDTEAVEVPLNASFSAMSNGDYGAFLRQIGPNVYVTVRVQGTFGTDADVLFADTGAIPLRFLPSFDGPQRITGTGDNGRVVGIYSNQDGPLRVGTYSADTSLTYIAGNGFWPAPSTDQFRQDV